MGKLKSHRRALHNLPVIHTYTRDLQSKTESNPVTVVECGLGYIYMAQRAAQDPALRKAYGEFEARVEALRRDRPEVARLVTTISQLSLLEDMNDDADSAFAVLQGLHGFYQIQQTRFEFMQQKIDDLHQGVDNASLNTRQKWVLGEIDVIVQKLRQVSKLSTPHENIVKFSLTEGVLGQNSCYRLSAAHE